MNEYFYKVTIELPKQNQAFIGVWSSDNAENALNGIIQFIEDKGFQNDQLEFMIFNRV